MTCVMPFTGPSLLHNMSCRPSTRVSGLIDPVAGRVVGFSLAHLRVRALRPDGRQLPRLDRHWAGLDLVGAVMMFPAYPNLDSEPMLWAQDPVLVKNVLARTRGALLLPGATACLDAALFRKSLATDDPRLVALARADALEDWS